MLEDPPDFHPQATAKWLEWRQEVRDGKRTFRFKERKGEYNFEGPVARPGAREERRPPPGGGDGGRRVTRSQDEDSAARKDGKPLSGQGALWMALCVLLAVIVGYGVMRWRSGKAR